MMRPSLAHAPAPSGPLSAEAALNEILGEMMMFQRSLARDHGLTLLQLMVLKTIESDGPQKPSQIADRFGVSRPAVSSEVNTLEARHWVRRAPEPGDRRSLRTSITPKGRQTLALMDIARHRYFQRGLAALEPEERAAVGELLGRVAARLRLELVQRTSPSKVRP